MLKWCAYCQQFSGESPEYHDFRITHVLCARCAESKFDLFGASAVEHAAFLRDIFDRLFRAGRRDDFETAADIVEEAVAAHCRPVDVLIGMIAPMLYRIGEDWERGTVTVEDEHRFTAFCERVIDLVESKMHAATSTAPRPDAPTFLLMNVRGNRHVLAIRILALWLQSRGMIVRVVDEPSSADALLQTLAAEPPGVFMMSMSMPEQRDHVAEIASRIQALPQAMRPRVIVGGYPVKVGLVQAIPGADLIADINTLSFA